MKFLKRLFLSAEPDGTARIYEKPRKDADWAAHIEQIQDDLKNFAILHNALVSRVDDLHILYRDLSKKFECMETSVSNLHFYGTAAQEFVEQFKGLINVGNTLLEAKSKVKQNPVAKRKR